MSDEIQNAKALDVTEVVKDESAFMASELPTPKYAWVALLTTWLVSIIIPMAWFCLPGIAGNVIGSFHINYPDMNPADYGTNFGLLMNAVSWAALIVAIPTGWVIRRIGPKTTLLIACGFTLIGALGLTLTYNIGYGYFLFFRIIEGIGIGMCSVTGPTAVAIWFSNKRRFLAIAIWSTWVPVGMLIVMNGGAAIVIDPFALPILFWAITILLAVAFVQFLLLYRLPSLEKGEVSEISVVRLDYKKALPFLKNRQFIGLLIAWMLFEFVNFAFTSYDQNFLTVVWGVPDQTAALLASIGNAAGIAAPLAGLLSDRLPWTKKWIIIVFGCVCLTIAAVVGWKVALFEFFIFYLIMHVVGNILLVGSVRPMVPFLIGRGGATVVAVGLSVLTLFQFGGEVLETLVPVALGIFNTAEAAAAGQIAPQAFELTTWFVLLPVMVVGTVFSLLVRPSKKQRLVMKADDAKKLSED
jgi:MFS family permease